MLKMGRTSDYTKQVRNEECENTVETKKSSKSFTDIKRMFCKRTNDSGAIWNIFR